jgi:tRNA 2-selenouridine synthase SelU
LEEASGKCSSGFASHLVNTLSGFDESMSVKIGYEDQIIAIFENELNKEILKLDDKNLSSLILDEMTIPVQEYDKRSHFLSFFKQNMSAIRQKIMKDYANDISSEDFDLYFRKAISHYEGC